MKVAFNQPAITGLEEKYIGEALRSAKISGDGPFGLKCQKWFEENLPCYKALMTPSCTAALELAALLINILPGDEVIMPSYTFVSTANAFVLRGAKIVFVDIRPDTMNIDENLITSAITEKTKAIVPVHYAGVACEMDAIMDIARQHNLYVIEDAAQGMQSTYKGKPLGTIGHFGAYSFHETKNYTSGGEGGLLIINDDSFKERAEIIREKGTNRQQFFRGMVDKYQWVELGSSYLPGELQSAFLWAQLERVKQINTNRLEIWEYYLEKLSPLQEIGCIELPAIPISCAHNGHMFYLKVRDLVEREKLLEYLRDNGVSAAFHYVPLHSASAGLKFGRFSGTDYFTTSESERLVRLPIWFGLDFKSVQYVVTVIQGYFK